MLVRILVLLFFALLALGSALGAEPRCLPELTEGASASALLAPASAEDAAYLLRRATELLEPALPVLRGAPDTGGLVPGEPGFDDVLYLASRTLLPPSWQPGALDGALWADMLASLAALYQVAPPTPSSDAPSFGEAAGDLATLIGRVAPTLEPVALIALSDSDASRIGFLAVIRNDSIYPRLIVMRPPEAPFDLRRGVAPVLPMLETCAMTLNKFISARESTASRLYLANSAAQMVVVDIGVSSQFAPHWVAQGEEVDYLRLSHPFTETLERFSVVFLGPSPAITTVLRIIPQLRTNMGPREIVRFVLEQ